MLLRVKGLTFYKNEDDYGVDTDDADDDDDDNDDEYEDDDIEGDRRESWHLAESQSFL